MATQQFQLPRSIILGGRESLEPALIHSQCSNHHLKLDAEFVALARAMYRGHCKDLCKEEGAERVKIKHYQSVAASAMSCYENRACFLPGESYIKHTLDQQLFLNRNSCKLTVSTLAHYASVDNPLLSIFPSCPVSHAFSLYPVLTRVDTVFSGRGGAKTWQYSTHKEVPIIGYPAFLDMIREAQRYDGVSVSASKIDRLPYVIKRCAEKAIIIFSGTPKPEIEILAEIKPVYQDRWLAVDIRYGNYYLPLNCGWKDAEVSIVQSKYRDRAQKKFSSL